jgi:hypothetical protein
MGAYSNMLARQILGESFMGATTIIDVYRANAARGVAVTWLPLT